jgi:hypothetical protein
MRALIASPWALVSWPAATAASTRAARACCSASVSFCGVTPSRFAASLTIASLSAFGEVSFVAAIAPPPPTMAARPTAATAIMRFRRLSTLLPSGRAGSRLPQCSTRA